MSNDTNDTEIRQMKGQVAEMAQQEDDDMAALKRELAAFKQELADFQRQMADFQWQMAETADFQQQIADIQRQSQLLAAAALTGMYYIGLNFSHVDICISLHVLLGSTRRD